MKKIMILVLVTTLMASLLLSGCAQKGKPVETPSQLPATEEPATKEPATKEAKSDAAIKEDSSQGVPFDKLLNEVQAKIQTHWPHMDKVWPTYDYTKHNLVLFHVNENNEVQEAWLLNSQGKRKLEPKEYEKIDAPMAGNYSQLTFENKPSVAMSVDAQDLSRKDAVEQTYRTATHELVHFYYQEDIKVSEQDRRAQSFPIDVKPRLYRHMVYERLMEAFENPKNAQEKLAVARYWYEKWKTEFPEEYKAIRATDIAEGTARYTENLGYFIKPDMKAEEFQKEAIKAFKRGDVFEAADAEGYEIGYVAALMLDQIKPGWKNTFYKEDKTIEEVLFQDITAKPEEMDPKLQKHVETELSNISNDIMQKIAPLTDAMKDKKVPYLRLTSKEDLTGFSVENMLVYEGKDVFSNFSALLNAQGSKIEINTLPITTDYDGENTVLNIPLNMKHEFKDGQLTVESDGLKVQSLKVTQSEEDGRIIYTTPLQ